MPADSHRSGLSLYNERHHRPSTTYVVGFMSATTTLTPALTKFSAIARPMPEAPPVISATLLFKSMAGYVVLVLVLVRAGASLQYNIANSASVLA